MSLQAVGMFRSRSRSAFHVCRQALVMFHIILFGRLSSLLMLDQLAVQEAGTGYDQVGLMFALYRKRLFLSAALNLFALW